MLGAKENEQLKQVQILREEKAQLTLQVQEYQKTIAKMNQKASQTLVEIRKRETEQNRMKEQVFIYYEGGYIPLN